MTRSGWERLSQPRAPISPLEGEKSGARFRACETVGAAKRGVRAERRSGALLFPLLDIGAQHGIHAPLVSRALALEIVEHVLIDADLDCPRCAAAGVMLLMYPLHVALRL